MAKQGKQNPEDEMIDFLAGMFGVKPDDVRQISQIPDSPDVVSKMSGVLTPQNQPEFWADAPWRLEPDRESLPVSFVLRDATLQEPAKGPWRLDLITLEQRLLSGSWHKLAAFTPNDIPWVDDQGFSTTDFWTYSTAIALSDLREARRGHQADAGGDPYRDLSCRARPAARPRRVRRGRATMVLRRHTLPFRIHQRYQGVRRRGG